MAGIADIARGSGVKRQYITDAFEEILAMVLDGHRVKVKGFGTFQRRKHSGRTVQSPLVQGGEPITYPDTYGIKFHQSITAKHRVNIVTRKQLAKKSAKKKTTKHPKKGK
jgi:nucleoid DNA-binding protein